MSDIPPEADYESTIEWLQAVAEETEADYETLAAVAARLRPELVAAPGSQRRDQLRMLLQEHVDFMTDVGGEAKAWIDVYFEQDGEVDSYYQYSMMNHNLAMASDEEVEAIEEIADEEEMELETQPEDNYVAASQFEWEGVEEELRLVETILQEVYDVDLADVERVEEQREGETISVAPA